MADWETRAVRSDGCRIAYDCRQGEGPEVVLLHGYGLDRTMWAPQLVALEGWTVLNLDIRGHGDSRPCADFSIPQAAEDLRAVLVKERCRAPVLVGLSMGGYVVQEYAWQFGGCAGYLVAGATPILLDCYSGWERAGLRASTPLLGVWPWRCLKSAMAMACSST
ncbi:MAG: alpha/beta fold hydrolase, partial [Flavonifractor plautii]